MHVIDPLSAAVGVESPNAHDLVDSLSAAVGVDRPHAHDPMNPLSAAVGVDGTLVIVLYGSVWICVCGCAAWIRWCAGGPDAHDLVDPSSGAVGVDRPHACYAHDLIDPLSGAVEVERPDAHDPVDPFCSGRSRQATCT